MANIIVYGGGFAGVAAAAKAASKAPNHEVILISPYPDDMLGGIGTSGGQNYWDTIEWPRGSLTARGSFAFWYDTYPKYYGVAEMSKLLKTESLGKYNNISVYTGYDISGFRTTGSPYRITSVDVKRIYRDADGYIKWGVSSLTFDGAVFIDASEEARLARCVNTSATYGRYDWPAAMLESAEQNRNYTARQQAATLMFKMKGISAASSGDMNYSQSAKGVWGCWGGASNYKNPNGRVAAFNNAHGPSGYMIKPVNAAQDGTNSPHWWINAFLVFNVDGRAHSRDEGSSFYPSSMLAGTKSTDRAWVDARRFLHANRAQFEGAMRSYPGFGAASLVYSDGLPEVGSVLYIRETVHMAKDSAGRMNGTEDRNYAVGATASLSAGDAPGRGADAANYASRIGLAMYNADVHPYRYTDLMKNGAYLWGSESWEKMRPDRPVTNPERPQYPVYMPYACLTTGYVANLLIPGYGAGVSSYSWGEVRVFPNLCVLGDAAGIAAAYSVNSGVQALDIGWSATHVKAVQNDLAAAGARLEK